MGNKNWAAIGFNANLADGAVVYVNINPVFGRGLDGAHDKVTDQVAVADNNIVPILPFGRDKILFPGLAGLLKVILEPFYILHLWPDRPPGLHSFWHAGGTRIWMFTKPSQGKIRHGRDAFPQQVRRVNGDIWLFHSQNLRSFHRPAQGGGVDNIYFERGKTPGCLVCLFPSEHSQSWAEGIVARARFTLSVSHKVKMPDRHYFSTWAHKR
jgi:hypothetical protein